MGRIGLVLIVHGPLLLVLRVEGPLIGIDQLLSGGRPVHHLLALGEGLGHVVVLNYVLRATVGRGARNPLGMCNKLFLIAIEVFQIKFS